MSSRVANSQVLRVLIVEDDPLIQIGLQQCLEQEPRLEIIGSEADGYLGVETALKLQPDLVIMDIGLPKLDGIEATKQIKAIAPEIKIAMLTSHKTDTEMLASLSSGADAFCVKGSSINSLLTAIAAVMEGGIYLDPQIARQAVQSFKNPVTLKYDIPLSRQELEVLKLIVEGQNNSEISAHLYISLSTVKTHVRSIMNKLAVDDRVCMAVAAVRSGLI
jgi:two-component system, NarL family, response regulator LiaR